jgi:Putative binding domain, N-terminal/Viral BACON domain
MNSRQVPALLSIPMSHLWTSGGNSLARRLRVSIRTMSRRSVTFFLSVFVVCSIGCGSGTTSVSPLAPSVQRCGVALAASPSTVGSSGGGGVLKIDTARECRWTLATTATWIRFGSAMEGQGPGEVAFTIEPNRSIQARQVELSVADVRAAISQQAAVCAWKMTPATFSVGATSGDIHATLATDDFCPWTLESDAPWIEITSDLSGSGPAEVTLHVDGNDGQARSGSVNFPSGAISVDQQESPKPLPVPVPVPIPVPVPAPAPGPAPKPTPCAYAVTPTKFDNVVATASDVSVDVTTTAACAWNASSSTSWIMVKSPAAGTGDGKVTLSVAANTGDKRSGSVVVTGRTINVTQNAAPCTYTVAPASLSLSNSAQTSELTVTTKGYCKVGVTSSAAWLHVGTFATTGGGKVPLTIDSNGTRTKRFATLTVTGDGGFTKAVPVDQNGR